MMRRPGWDGLPPVPSCPEGTELAMATAEDVQALAGLLASAFPEFHWTPSRAREAFVEDPYVPATFVVRSSDGRLLATASAQWIPAYSPDGFLHWVATAPEARGMGLGALVSLAAMHRLRELGFPASRLSTDDERIPAIRTYLRLGFLPVVVDETHPGRWRALADQLPEWREAVLAAIGLG